MSWLTDSLGTPSENAQLEDATFTSTMAAPRQKLENYIQIFMRDCSVSDSQEAVLKAGVKSEMAYQLQKVLKLIALDVEYAIVNNKTAVQGSSTVAGKFGGIPYFNTVNNITTPALTEQNIEDAIQAAWKVGGLPDMLVCSGNNKKVIDKMTTGATRNMNYDNDKLKQVVNVYESSFGLVNVQMHRLYDDKRIDLLQTEYWKLAYLIPFKTVDRPKDGLMNGKVVTGQMTLECRSKEANSCITIGA